MGEIYRWNETVNFTVAFLESLLIEILVYEPWTAMMFLFDVGVKFIRSFRSKGIKFFIFIVTPCMLSSYSIITPTTAHI